MNPFKCFPLSYSINHLLIVFLRLSSRQGVSPAAPCLEDSLCSSPACCSGAPSLHPLSTLPEDMPHDRDISSLGLQRQNPASKGSERGVAAVKGATAPTEIVSERM